MTIETTSFPNGIDGFIIDDQAVEKTTAQSPFTVTINQGDSGKTFYVKEAVTFTLPGIAIGNVFTFVNMADDGKAALTISPNAADGISYVGSATDDKDLINTAATHKKGDFVTLAALDQVVAWQVTAIRGIWAKET